MVRQRPADPAGRGCLLDGDGQHSHPSLEAEFDFEALLDSAHRLRQVLHHENGLWLKKLLAGVGWNLLTQLLTFARSSQPWSEPLRSTLSIKAWQKELKLRRWWMPVKKLLWSSNSCRPKPCRGQMLSLNLN